MTNEAAQLLIAETETKLRRAYLLEPIAGWSATAISGVSGLLMIGGWGVPLLAVAGGVGLWSVYVTEGVFQRLHALKVSRELHVWRDYTRSDNFSAPTKAMALEIKANISEIYSREGGETLLPLSQAIRLLDVYLQQQRQSNALNAHLGQLYSLRIPFTTKTAQLQALGETRAKSPEEAQLDTEIERAESAHAQIERSCERLANIIEDAKQAMEKRQLHLELESLRAQLPRPTPTIEPAFAPESLEEIERQIGREIETYLQLERETEEHLR